MELWLVGVAGTVKIVLLFRWERLKSGVNGMKRDIKTMLKSSMILTPLVRKDFYGVRYIIIKPLGCRRLTELDYFP